jgi:hypothetical protein
VASQEATMHWTRSLVSFRIADRRSEEWRIST